MIQISPADLVARTTTTAGKEHELILVTGDSGAGKTNWCLELIRQARAVGVEPVGLVSLAVFAQGVKTGIDLINITTGERRRLAMRRNEGEPPESPLLGRPPESLLLGRPQPLRATDTLGWRFDPETFTWGNQILEGLQHGELLILDELGPLEFLSTEGLIAGLKCIDSRDYRLACVVVRLKLLATALDRWPWGQVIRAASQPLEGRWA